MQINSIYQQTMSPIEMQKYSDSVLQSNKSTAEAILESIREVVKKNEDSFVDNKAIAELTGKGMYLNVLA